MLLETFSIYNPDQKDKVVIPLSWVLPSALAVEVACTRYTGAPVQAGVGGTRAYANLTVGAHERGRTLTKVACRIEKKKTYEDNETEQVDIFTTVNSQILASLERIAGVCVVS